MIRTCLYPGRSFLSVEVKLFGWSCMKKTSEVNKGGWSKCWIWTKNGSLRLSNGKVFHAPVSDCRLFRDVASKFYIFYHLACKSIPSLKLWIYLLSLEPQSVLRLLDEILPLSRRFPWMHISELQWYYFLTLYSVFIL